MRPPLSVTGTRWTRWTPLSNFSLANTPLPSTEATTSLKPARVGGRGGDQLDPPALPLGIALVHAEQVAREQAGFVAAGPGADFEHRRALVGGVARQQRERQRAFGRRERALVISSISSRAIALSSPSASSSSVMWLSVASSARSRRTSPAAFATGSSSAYSFDTATKRSPDKSPVAISAPSSSRRASICAIRWGEMEVTCSRSPAKRRWSSRQRRSILDPGLRRRSQLSSVAQHFDPRIGARHTSPVELAIRCDPRTHVDASSPPRHDQ